MTELQFLIKILTQHKLSPAMKDIFIERIGEVEISLSSKAPPVVRPLVQPAQAPSMQKILDEMASETPQQAPLIRAPVGGEVVTSKGNGAFTKGPRKF